ncbi:hypothetical protein PF010_g2900 [Phytophthora fragariae]|uniref:Uncharacterized protein n=1 Tax=Phytophthora fragariae TaxID=53985 RepID=A0A6A4ABN4_9STRA|nr:hypothetical protein PF003_g35083 [Phytophthora fragariae]KAE9132594.1 hypothetical protein PF007_g3660 [Phytophthora fragariae]KAE9133195.1 hypothetical protein PF010_g2900 [Phytophthora fragariae]KAE9152855.1 hypothetical protein PF006_g2950 [Phytophthora fragariae]KAE9251241.1 hypothetical protein PF004_g2572 [Phytophthora fragariae]
MTPDTTLILSVITRKFMASSSVFPMHVPPIKTPSSSLMSMVSASEFMIESEVQPRMERIRNKMLALLAFNPA